MKRILLTLLAAALICCLAACKKDDPAPTGPVMVQNPFTQCANMATAEGGAGFEMDAPTELGEYGAPTIRVMKGYMIELIYSDGTDEIRIRKAVGEGDISGDYNTYPESGVFSLSGAELTIKGDGSGYMLATWTRDGYAYSITSGAPHSREFMLQLAATIN